MNHLEDLQTTLLLGTDRSSLTDGLQAYLREQGLNGQELPAEMAAEALVLHRQWTRAGFLIPVWTESIPQIQLQQAENECSAEAAHCLQAILDGRYPDALPEWVKLLLAAQQVLPRQALPALLQRCTQDPALWDTLKPALGERGHWLMQQHPLWIKLSTPFPDPGAWATTTGPARLSLLRSIRQQSAAQGLQLLQSTWLEEDPAQKPALLEGLSIGLNREDEVFLEACLQERRKEIRQIAAELLACIPGAGLIDRYLQYLQECIVVVEQRINVRLPEEIPEEWRKDGVEPGSKRPFSLTQRSAWLFQLIRRLPPGHWQTHWGLSPQEAIGLFAQQDREESWVQALTDAALLHQDLVWQEALATWWLHHEQASSWQTSTGRHLLQQLPGAILQKILVPYLQKRPYLLEDDHVATFILCATDEAWSDELSLALVQPLMRYLAGGDNPFWNIWHYARLLKALAYHCNPGLLEQLNNNWVIDSALGQRWQAEVERMLAVIQFRAKMIATF